MQGFGVVFGHFPQWIWVDDMVKQNRPMGPMDFSPKDSIFSGKESASGDTPWTSWVCSGTARHNDEPHTCHFGFFSNKAMTLESIMFDAELWVFCSWMAPKKLTVFSGQVGHREGVPLPQTHHRAERFRYH